MKIQILIGVFFLFLNTLALGQTRTGTGPNDLLNDPIENFLISLNEKSASCSGEKTKFKNLSEFKLNYSVEEIFEKKTDPNCLENAIPKKYLCIFDKALKKELSSLLKHEGYFKIVKAHGESNNISEKEISSIFIFLNDLDLKLNNEEKK